MRRLVAALTVSTAVVALAACSSDEPMPDHRVLQAGAPGEQPVQLTEMPTVPDAEITADEVNFVRHMIVHHGQALQMTELVPGRSSRDDVPLFAERIQLSQEDEIRLMEEWLQDHSIEVLRIDQQDGAHGAHATPDDMPGMITEEQLAELEQASGEEFDRMFLELMYAHHEGAVQMVQTLHQGEQSSEPVIFNLVREIDGDQRIEMDRIVGMLSDLDG
jgi:uncharacterized protein (DUF305 family)